MAVCPVREVHRWWHKKGGLVASRATRGDAGWGQKKAERMDGRSGGLMSRIAVTCEDQNTALVTHESKLRSIASIFDSLPFNTPGGLMSRISASRGCWGCVRSMAPAHCGIAASVRPGTRAEHRPLHGREDECAYHPHPTREARPSLLACTACACCPLRLPTIATRAAPGRGSARRAQSRAGAWAAAHLCFAPRLH